MKTKTKPKHKKARARDRIILALQERGMRYTKTWLDSILAGRGHAHIFLAEELSEIVGGAVLTWIDPKRVNGRKCAFCEYADRMVDPKCT